LPDHTRIPTDYPWKLSALRHQSGQISQLTPKVFVVLVATLDLPPLPPLGSIADRQYCSKIANANGKNFITVNVELPGGAGAMIAPPMNLPIEFPIIVEIAIQILIAFLVTFKLVG
jgi:hypothetical protein